MHRRRPRHNLDCDIRITHLGATNVESNQQDPFVVKVDEVDDGKDDEIVEEENRGIDVADDEVVEWLQVNVNAPTDGR